MRIADLIPMPIKDFARRELKARGYALSRVKPYIKEPYGRGLYEELYSADSLINKRFYNIGSGDWRHPLWTNIDYDSDHYSYDQSLIDINWDAFDGVPFPIESNTAELAYCSHTVEHLLDSHNQRIFEETLRILKPGAGIRITTPNAELYWHAYKRKDVHFSYHLGYNSPWGSSGLEQWNKENFAQYILSETFTQLCRHPEWGNCRYPDPKEIGRIFDEMGMKEAFEFFSKQIDFDIQRKNVGCHVNYWTGEKMACMLRRAGFSEIIVNGPGQSIFPVMRDTRFFDLRIPTCSLFVDAVK